MGLFDRGARRARPTDRLPAPVDPDTQVGASQLGRDSGPGMVPRHRAFTDPDAGGRASVAPTILAGGAVQLDALRIPESFYADRPMTGGAAAHPHYAQFIEEPGNTGGHQIITGRTPFVIGDVQVEREQLPSESYREPPRPSACRTPQVSA